MNSFSNEIRLAPLRGYTDVIFRNTYTSFFSGVDGAIAPFLTTIKGPRIKPSHLKDVLPDHNRKLPVVPQILGKSSAHFIELAKELDQLGYTAVNWNLGCPYPMVTKKGRGAGLLPHPDKVAGFLDDVMAAIPNSLSIKLRLGLWNPLEIDALFPVFNQYPLDELIIHPRTGKQMYDGIPDEEGFESCLAQTHHRIVYNGDIWTKEDYQRLQAKFPSVTGWMIGRGILADPLLPARIKNIDIGKDEQIHRLQQFHAALFDGYATRLYGPGHLLSRMKGFWRYFYRSFKNGPGVLKKILKCRTLESYRYHVDFLFDSE